MADVYVDVDRTRYFGHYFYFRLILVFYLFLFFLNNFQQTMIEATRKSQNGFSAISHK